MKRIFRTPLSLAAAASLCQAAAAAPITLEWTDNSPNEAGFAIERSAGGSAFREIARVPPNTTRFVDRPAVAARGEFTYRVRAFNRFGFSGYTNTAHAALQTLAALVPDTRAQARSSLIGKPSDPGVTHLIDGPRSLVLAAAGKGFEQRNDELRFHHVQVDGDFRMVLRIVSFLPDGKYARVGLMLRQGLASDAAHAAFTVDGRRRLGSLSRKQAGDAIETDDLGHAHLPCFLAMEKRGSTLSLETSRNGQDWKPIASFATTLDGPLFLGPVIGSHRGFSVARLDIDSFQRGRPAAGRPGEEAFALASRRVGRFPDRGSYSYQPDTATHLLSAAGRGFERHRDELRFACLPASGDGQIVARVQAFDPDGAWARAGILFRPNLEPEAPYAAIALNGKGQAEALLRARAGGETLTRAQSSPSQRPFLRLSKSGDRFLFEYSQDGYDWTMIERSRIAFPDQFLVGLCLGSQNDRTFSIAGLEVLESSFLPIPPSLHLYRDSFQRRRVDLPRAGAAYRFDPDTRLHHLGATGLGHGRRRDVLNFPSWRIDGDVRIAARLESFEPDDDWARAGLMLRQSDAADAAHASMVVNGKGRLQALWRPKNGAALQSVTGPPADQRTHLALQRRQGEIAFLWSTDGVSWRQLAVAKPKLDRDCRAGLVLGSHRRSGSSRAKIRLLGLY